MAGYLEGENKDNTNRSFNPLHPLTHSLLHQLQLPRSTQANLEKLPSTFPLKCPRHTSMFARAWI